MSAVFHTGRKALLRPALMNMLSDALGADGGDIIVLVPEQLTLETEINVLRGLNLTGSFRLSVLSPERLCRLVFDTAGRPALTCIDERGRAMLMGRALRTLNRRLKWYAGAKDRRGFEARVISEITRLKQADITPKTLSEYAENAPDGALKSKLTDMALLYAEYEKALEGRFQDGEDEISEAIARMHIAPFIKAARVFVFGFDLTPPIINRLLAALARECVSVDILIPLENNGEARDFSLFMPLQSSYERLVREMSDSGVKWSRKYLKQEEKFADNAAAHFAKEAFCSPAEIYKSKNTSLQVAALKNPMDEARFAAALIRRLVMKNGWRYSDVLVLADDLNTYSDALDSAFLEYEVPLFTSESRPALCHTLPRFICETLEILSGTGGDLNALLNTGCANITDDERDTLLSYCSRYALRPRDILKPFKRINPETGDEAESIRKKLAEPLSELDNRLSSASLLSEQLTAIYNYVETLGCIEKGEALRKRLIELGQRTAAAEDAQVWNRVMGTLDQMNELMGEKRLSKALLADLMSRAFTATVIKPLPQSGDSVNAVSALKVGFPNVKAVIVIGATVAGAKSPDGLLMPDETHTLSASTGKHIALDSLSQTRYERAKLKDALSLASDYVCITYPISAQDGSALSPSALISEVKRIFPDVRIRGGVSGDDAISSMRCSAPRSAETIAASELSLAEMTDEVLAAVSAMSADDNARKTLEALERARTQVTYSEDIGEELARRVYGKISTMSVTRLESFAQCPFAHFVRYALRPERDEPFILNAKDEGGFYHEAVRSFLKDNASELSQITADEAGRRMNAVADRLFEGVIKDVLDDSAMSRAAAVGMRRTVNRAAKAICAQLNGGEFSPIELEMEFGDSSTALRLRTGARLKGRIDRIDALGTGDDMYLRVIDYKRGSKTPDASEIYNGIQLQLIIYLAAAIEKFGGKSAGVYYFRIDDPVITTESTDASQIERERFDKLRLAGLLPDDTSVIRRMAGEPERAIKLKFLKSGELDSRTPKASDAQFNALINRALDKASEYAIEISNGVTRISPVKTDLTDACMYCDYKASCMSDKRIPGGEARRIRKMTFDEAYEKLQGGY